jgi:hypothetical protein
VKTECQIVRERDFKLVGTEVIDVSVRGMLLMADLPVLTGEELIVTFKGPATSRWYDCGGMVARVLHGRRREDRRRAVGVAFEGLGPFHELLLCDELAKTPLVLHRRQPRLELRRSR